MKCENLEQVRENIDRIDNEIIKLIAERGTYVVQASAFKKDEEGVKDTGRVEKVISKVRAKAEEYGADPDMVEELGIQTRCGRLLTGAVSIALFLLSCCLLNGITNLVHSHQHLLLKIVTLVV